MRKPKRPHRNPAPGEHRIMITNTNTMASTSKMMTNTMAITAKTNTIHASFVEVKTTTMAAKRQLTSHCTGTDYCNHQDKHSHDFFFRSKRVIIYTYTPYAVS